MEEKDLIYGKKAFGDLGKSARDYARSGMEQEAVVGGVLMTIDQNDSVVTTYRDHGHMIARGLNPKNIMAELTGRISGYSKGKGGSMHICDLDLAMLGAHGIVGAGVPISVGAAYANKLTSNDLISVSFFGDGATNIGAFHEAANMAAALSLPMLFVCENNQFATEVPFSYEQMHSTFCFAGATDGLPKISILDSDR